MTAWTGGGRPAGERSHERVWASVSPSLPAMSFGEGSNCPTTARVSPAPANSPTISAEPLPALDRASERPAPMPASAVGRSTPVPSTHCVWWMHQTALSTIASSGRVGRQRPTRDGSRDSHSTLPASTVADEAGSLRNSPSWRATRARSNGHTSRYGGVVCGPVHEPPRLVPGKIRGLAEWPSVQRSAYGASGADASLRLSAAPAKAPPLEP